MPTAETPTRFICAVLVFHASGDPPVTGPPYMMFSAFFTGIGSLRFLHAVHSVDGNSAYNCHLLLLGFMHAPEAQTHLVHNTMPARMAARARAPPTPTVTPTVTFHDESPSADEENDGGGAGTCRPAGGVAVVAASSG